jgi:outer membrane lipoprotein SlyB
MTQPTKLQSLLENGSVVASVGDRPRAHRSVFKHLAATALVLAGGAIGTVQAQTYTAAPYQAESQEQRVEEGVRGIHGQVQSVRRVNDRSNRGGTHRGRISLGTIAGAVVGGALGNQVGGGDGKKLATVVGALAGGSVANRIADRRHNQAQQLGDYQNARRVQDDVVVTVAVRVGNTFETYEIVQPAAIPLRRGDDVVLATSQDGRQLMALPIIIEPEPNSAPRRRMR